MAKADDELITDWILPAEAMRLLVERWGDRNVCEGLARKALTEGVMPWWCRMVEGGAEKNPDLLRGRFQILWKENWAQEIGPKPADWGPRHWFELSRAWVLALPEKPGAREKAAIHEAPATPPETARKRPRRDQVEAVRDELWPKGVPEKSAPGDLLKTLGDELDRRGIAGSQTTQRRALGLRK